MSVSKSKNKMMIQNNTVYDVLKYFAQIILPALATLYFALSEIWGLSHGAEVVGTIAAVDAFLGMVLRISTKAYDQSDARFDGSLDITETDDGVRQFTLALDGDPEYELQNKEEILFKVNKLRDSS